MLIVKNNWCVCLSSAGTTTEGSPPGPPPPDAQPIQTKGPEEEMDVVDDDISAGKQK